MKKIELARRSALPTDVVTSLSSSYVSGGEISRIRALPERRADNPSSPLPQPIIRLNAIDVRLKAIARE